MFALQCRALSRSPQCTCDCIKIMVLRGNQDAHRLQVQADCSTKDHGRRDGKKRPQGGIMAKGKGWKRAPAPHSRRNGTFCPKVLKGRCPWTSGSLTWQWMLDICVLSLWTMRDKSSLPHVFFLSWLNLKRCILVSLFFQHGSAVEMNAERAGNTCTGGAGKHCLDAHHASLCYQFPPHPSLLPVPRCPPHPSQPPVFPMMLSRKHSISRSLVFIHA